MRDDGCSWDAGSSSLNVCGGGSSSEYAAQRIAGAMAVVDRSRTSGATHERSDDEAASDSP